MMSTESIVKHALQKAQGTLQGVLEGAYQIDGTEWMLSRELTPHKSHAGGGILADDMGLGKTMQAIAMMRGNPCATLIVTMVGTVGQWKDALIDFGGYRPLIVNPSFAGILPMDEDDTSTLVVLTSYSSFQKSRGTTPQCLTDMMWGRIILDEGHVIRNEKTKVFREISSVQAKNKWVLSGTPIQNASKDLWTLAKWIGIVDCTSIEDLYSRYILRRTQGGMQSTLKLPDLETKVLFLQFKDCREAKLYSMVETHFSERLDGGVPRNQTYHTAMEGIVRCRQICTHPSIYLDSCNKKLTKSNSSSSTRKRKIDTDLTDCIGSCVYTDKLSSPITSTKLSYLCEDIQENVIAPKTKLKCLIFSSWTMEMKLIQQELKGMKISSLIFDGSLSRDAKQNVLYNFNHSAIPVLILQINCGSTGLNLQCASRVYIMSPNWNPCVELQAIGRAYRKGQTKKVTCVRLVMKDTIEERCLEIQKKKTSLIMNTMMDKSIMSKLGTVAEDGLTTDDISTIFQPLTRPTQTPFVHTIPTPIYTPIPTPIYTPIYTPIVPLDEIPHLQEEIVLFSEEEDVLIQPNASLPRVPSLTSDEFERILDEILKDNPYNAYNNIM